MSHREQRSRVAYWENGPTLVSFGAFSIRERWLMRDTVRMLRKGEIVFVTPSTNPNQKVEVIPIALVDLRRTDLVYVVRWARVWVNGRRQVLAKVRAQSHISDATAQHTPYAEGVTKSTSTSDVLGDTHNEQHTSARDKLESAEVADADEEKAWELAMERETELVARALEELEAQHPELDLEPFEETNNPDPELDAAIRQMEQDSYEGDGFDPRHSSGTRNTE